MGYTPSIDSDYLIGPLIDGAQSIGRMSNPTKRPGKSGFRFLGFLISRTLDCNDGCGAVWKNKRREMDPAHDFRAYVATVILAQAVPRVALPEGHTYLQPRGGLAVYANPALGHRCFSDPFSLKGIYNRQQLHRDLEIIYLFQGKYPIHPAETSPKQPIKISEFVFVFDRHQIDTCQRGQNRKRFSLDHYVPRRSAGIPGTYSGYFIGPRNRRCPEHRPNK